MLFTLTFPSDLLFSQETLPTVVVLSAAGHGLSGGSFPLLVIDDPVQEDGGGRRHQHLGSQLPRNADGKECDENMRTKSLSELH